MTLEKHLEREFWVLRRYIFCYARTFYFNFVQLAAFEKYDLFDLVLM